jgi:hypothetical protein
MLSHLTELLVLTALAIVPATSQAVPPLTEGIAVKARVFDISQVVIDNGRMKENEVSNPRMTGEWCKQCRLCDGLTRFLRTGL